MKVVHVTSDVRRGSPSCLVALLSNTLRSLGLDSSVVTRFVSTKLDHVSELKFDKSVTARLRRVWRRARISHATTRPARLREAYEAFDDCRSQFGADFVQALPNCDVISLHFVAGLLDFRSFFKTNTRRTHIVWTLHDMNAFTGGCHYDNHCGRYKDECGKCPQLGSSRADDQSRRILREKKSCFEALKDRRIIAVTPSLWLAKRVRESTVMRDIQVEVIPNGIDTEIFKPYDQALARRVFGIPIDRKVILFVAQSLSNRRKGFQYLVEAVRRLYDDKNMYLISIGACAPEKVLPVPHYSLGMITLPGIMALAYSAADVFVMPSIQDNLPTTILESIACGTPVIGFDVGGIPEMVRDDLSGIVVRRHDSGALADSIYRLLNDDQNRKHMRATCRSLAEHEYTVKLQARRYKELYERLILQ
ncbi:MAG: glycosyltransferase [Lentisphaerae bacterium]|nr:glycosyltransferase [Lentisphaerota bacterium]